MLIPLRYGWKSNSWEGHDYKGLAVSKDAKVSAYRWPDNLHEMTHLSDECAAVARIRSGSKQSSVNVMNVVQCAIVDIKGFLHAM